MALQVGPYNPHDPNDEIERKLYYQWVPFVLFLQGVMFYVPHLIFKAFEGKKLDSIIAGLNNWVMSNSERKGKEEELATYIRETKVSLWCFFTSRAAAESYRGVGSSSGDFCFLAMVSSF